MVATFLIFAILCEPIQVRQQRELIVKVVFPDTIRGDIPQNGVEVGLEGLGVAKKTDNEGIVWLKLPSSRDTGDEVILTIKKPKYKIFWPFKGKTILKKDLKVPIILRILPLGDPRFKDLKTIEQYLSDYRAKSSEEFFKDDKSKKLNLNFYIGEFAKEYNLSFIELRIEVDNWIANNAKSSDPLKRAVAEFAKENFTLAGELFGEAAALRLEQKEKFKNESGYAVDKLDSLSKEIVDALRDKGRAYYRAYRFGDALQAFRQSLSEINREQTPHLWAELQNDLGVALASEGKRISGTEGADLLAQAESAYRAALEIYALESMSKQLALTKKHLKDIESEKNRLAKAETKRRRNESRVAAARAGPIVVDTEDMLKMRDQVARELEAAAQARKESEEARLASQETEKRLKDLEAEMAARLARAEQIADFSGGKIEVKPVEEGNVLSNVLMTLRINFDFDKAIIRTDEFPTMFRVVDILQTYPEAKVQISGHTDNIGTDIYNMKLSQARLNCVMSFLERHGIDSTHFFMPVPYGEWRPLTENRTEEQRFRNRRVEFLLFTGNNEPVVPEGSKITDVKVTGDSTITIVGNGRLNYVTGFVDNPPRLILKFPKVYAADSRSFPLNVGSFLQARLGYHPDERSTWVVFDLSTAPRQQPIWLSKDNRLFLHLRNGSLMEPPPATTERPPKER